MPPPGSIFISYRRSDSIESTGRIYDYLEPHFGREHVFKDVDSIPLGVNFREYLDQEVGCCQVLVAVIGPTWLTVTGKDGKRRLDSPNDIVRIEIESALRPKIPVIRLLVNGASMPDKTELPGELKALPDWQSIVIRHDPDFRRDVKKLIQGIELLLGKTQRDQAAPVSSASPPRTSGSLQRDRPKTRAIPWLRLAAIFGLYGLQGYYMTMAGTGTGTMAWAWAVAVTITGTMAWAIARVVLWDVDAEGTGAVAWTMAWAMAGIELKAHFTSTQVFWILWGTAIAGLGFGALLGVVK